MTVWYKIYFRIFTNKMKIRNNMYANKTDPFKELRQQHLDVFALT